MRLFNMKFKESQLQIVGILARSEETSMANIIRLMVDDYINNNSDVIKEKVAEFAKKNNINNNATDTN